MVDYDSIIPPGRAGKITEKINISSYSGGKITKSVRVLSNAENSPDIRLSVSIDIVPVIDVGTRFIRMKANTTAELTLRTKKADLLIHEATFVTDNAQSALWQSTLPNYCAVEMNRSDKKDQGGYFTYTVHLGLDMDLENNQYGEFTLLTNHPEKSTIKIRGMISTQ